MKPGLTAFQVNGTCIVGVVQDGNVNPNGFTYVDKAIVLRFVQTQDPMGNPGIGMSPMPILPANGPVGIHLPPCPHFYVGEDQGVIGMWEAMCASSDALVVAPPLPDFMRGRR